VKKYDIKKAKKLLKNKYTLYRQATIKARKFVDECVETKKQGRDILKRVVEGEKGDKIIEEILRY
jgi:hypothetical protein